MMKKFKRAFNQCDISDMYRINRLALSCYLLCCIIYTILGVLSYRTIPLHKFIFEPAAYYVLLYLPLVCAFLVYREDGSSYLLKYVLFGLFGLFYGYVLFAGREYLAFLYVIPMLGVAIAYYEPHFSLTVSIAAVLLNVFVATEWFDGSKIRVMQTDKVFVVMAIVVISFMLNLCAHVMSLMQHEKLNTINQEKEKFKALMSVGVRKIFEYDIPVDELTITESNNGDYGKERYIRNVKKIVKQYRYVLFADWDIFDQFIRQCEEGNEYIDIELRIRDNVGDYKWNQVRGKMVYDEKANPVKLIGTMEDVDERKRMEIRQADESMRDPLTKLYRARYAKQLIQEFLKKQNCSEYAGFLILDIDNFEILNEKMGRAFGDEILKNIAADIENIFYPTDILGRIGGDEFVILMKNIRDIHDIERKIKEIQRVINKTYIGETMNFGSTVGVGAAVYPIDGVDLEELYQRAEKALYLAKSAGKNCYSFYDSKKEEEYSQFCLEEKHEKLLKAQQREEAMEYQKPTDSLTELAFKLIEESKDTDSAINLLIRQVARQMDLGSICIRSRVNDKYEMEYPYQCCLCEERSESAGSMEYTKEQWEEMIAEFDKGNGLVYVSDISQIENDTRRKLMLAYGARSFARCAFYDKGEFVGNIDFVDFDKERAWTQEELMTIRAVTNVVSAYLLKMKAYEDASETVDRLTGYDALTGYYKYEKFLELVTDFIENAPHGRYAITYVDFSNFKFINEVYGYETGDKILKDFADTAADYSKAFIYGSRVFSDNIVSLIRLENCTDNDIVTKLTQASHEFTDKIQQEYLDSNLVIDIGVCPFDIDGNPIPIKNIISNANLARKEAKKPDHPRCVIYSMDMGEKLKQEIAYTNDMENAFKNHEFVVYLQPKVDLKSNEIEGAEALIRWKKKDGTIIYPNDFIPVFEKNKTITLLDYFVYTEVCKYLADRIARNEKVVCISVNVSRVHLFSIRQMVSYVRGLLKKYDIPPQLLEFELTETVFTEKVEDTILLMNELRKLGVKVSMDDFGSGYSSLNVLTKLPLDVLKLDKDFLKDFTQDNDEKVIIPAIIDMARKLHLSVVCEGVETLEQVEFLKGVGCDYAQGYYYSKPVPVTKFDELIQKENVK